MHITLKKSLVIALLTGVAAAGWVAASGGFERSGNKRPTVTVAVSDTPLERQTKFTASFSPVVKKVAPSVVNVFTTKTVRNPWPEVTPFFDDPFFRRFFGQPFGDNEGRRQPRTFKERSLGSGVIVTRDGYLLTNNHVVDGADEIKVARDKDKKQFTAKIVGRDPKTDIAVLKIDAKDLPFITFADSDKLEVGDVVLALGNPFGIGQTVTMGIVSATGRGGMNIEDYEDFIQTDAAINPGNSGGALVDAEGRLIGINTAIFSRTGGNQGIGFAIPANLARDVMNSLVTDGKVTRGYFGVMIQDVTPALARKLDLKQRKGALVGDVVPKGPADKAGIQSGDVVTELDGTPVTDSRHLKLAVARAKPGEHVRVKVLRDGSTKTLDVTVKELPDSEPLAKSDSHRGDDSEALKGVAVADIDTQ